MVNAQLDSLPEKRFWLATNPLTLIDPYFGSSCRIGVAFNIHNNISEYLEYGGYIRSFNIWDVVKNNAGFTAKAETRSYIKSYETDSKIFLSIELFYSQQSCVRNDSIEIRSQTLPTTYNKFKKEYSINKKVAGLTLNLGTTAIYYKRFVLEGFVGLGVRYRETTCTLTQEEAENRILGDWTVPGTWIYRCGNFISPHLNLGFRIGYKIL